MYVCVYEISNSMTLSHYLEKITLEREARLKHTLKTKLFHSLFPRKADEINLGNSKHTH